MSRPEDPIVSAAAHGKTLVKYRSKRLRRRAQRVNRPPPLRGPPPVLTALDLEKIVTVREAGEMLGLSYWSLWRHYRHLFRQLSPNRVGIKLRDVIAIGEAARARGANASNQARAGALGRNRSKRQNVR